MNLRLHDDNAAAEAFGHGGRFSSIEDDFAARNWHAESGENGFGLVFVNLQTVRDSCVGETHPCYSEPRKTVNALKRFAVGFTAKIVSAVEGVMKRFSVMSAVIGVVLVTVALSAQAPQGGGRAGGAAPQGGGGRGGGPQVPTPKNLQFFPKDMTGQQILPIMQNFNAALGVNCTYCHNSEPPVDNPKNDFASDEKETKKKARVMLVLARDINMKLQSELGKPANQLTNVQCVTCHRGVAIPKQLTAIMMETAGTDGVAKALQQYQDLRKQYYGAQAYDFTDVTLFTAANQSLAANKPDDAIAFAQLNLAFHANSARSYQVMSQAYQRKNDKDKAIQSLEKAVELDPMNQGFKNQLQQLKAGA
jgi:hypothetical protein